MYLFSIFGALVCYKNFVPSVVEFMKLSRLDLFLERSQMWEVGSHDRARRGGGGGGGPGAVQLYYTVR